MLPSIIPIVTGGAPELLRPSRLSRVLDCGILLYGQNTRVPSRFHALRLRHIDGPKVENIVVGMSNWLFAREVFEELLNVLIYTFIRRVCRKQHPR